MFSAVMWCLIPGGLLGVFANKQMSIELDKHNVCHVVYFFNSHLFLSA